MSENPYLSPLKNPAIPADAAASGSWKVSANRLLVSPNTILPTVDPHDGQSSEQMTFHRVLVKNRPFWTIYLFIGAIALIVASTAFPPMAQMPFALVGAAGVVAAWIAVLVCGTVELKVFYSKTTARKELIGEIVGAVLTFSLFALIALNFAGSHFNEWFIQIRKIAGVLFTLSAATHVILSFFLRKLTCRRKIDGLYEIRGIHPDAIDRLRKLESFKQSSSARTAPSSSRG